MPGRIRTPAGGSADLVDDRPALSAARELVAAGAGVDDVLAALALVLAAGEPVPGALGARRPPADLIEVLSRLSVVADPGLLGRVHEVLVAPDDRRRRGVHYTPPALAERLVDLAADSVVGGGPVDGVLRVCDPSCGGGAFLLAAARWQVAAGADPGAVLDGLHGIDVDELAAAVSQAVLAGWARAHGLDGAAAAAQVARLDALLDPWPADWEAFDLVVGNPPFAGQLSSATARSRDVAAVGRDLLGRPAGYADTAGLFLVRSLDALRPGGVACLLQPQSVLAARDAEPVRRSVHERADVVGAWVAGERVFAASVHVCAPVLRRRAPARADHGEGGPESGPDGEGPPVAVMAGPGLSDRGAVAVERLGGGATWAPLWARAHAVPDVESSGGGVVGDWCEVRAGFRDEYYALAPLVVEGRIDDDRPRVVTAGLIDPGGVAWGRRTTRLAGRRLAAPVVDRDALERAIAHEPRLAAWADLHARPKVVLATQTAVLEAAVDDDGRWWPSVPVISLRCEHVPDDVEHRWLVAAALLAPPATAWALARAGGTALSPRAVKLSARHVRQVPLPSDRAAWEEGAALLRGATEQDHEERLLAAGEVLTAAHGIRGDRARDLVGWWRERLPAP